MFTPPDFDAGAEAPVDRWAVRLDEPDALQPIAHTSDADAALLPLFTLELPTLEFQPRLSRFEEAA